MGTVGAGSTRTPACSESGVAVGVNHMALDRSTRWFEEIACTVRAEDPRSPFFRAWQCSQSGGPRTYPFGQCRCGGIQHIGCCTLLPSCGFDELDCGTVLLLVLR